MSKVFGHLHVKLPSARSSVALCCPQSHMPMTLSAMWAPKLCSSIPKLQYLSHKSHTEEKDKFLPGLILCCDPKSQGAGGLCWRGTLLTFVQIFSCSFPILSLNYWKKSFYSRSWALNWTFWSSRDPCELTSPASFPPHQHSGCSQVGGVWSLHHEFAAWINVCSHHPRVTCWIENRCISPPYCPGLLLYLAWNNFQTCVRNCQTGPEGRIPVLLQRTALTSVQSHFWHVPHWLFPLLQTAELEPLNILIWEALGSK